MTGSEITELQMALSRALEGGGSDARLTVLASAVVGLVGEMHVTRQQAVATRDHIEGETQRMQQRLERIEAGLLDEDHRRAVQAAVALASSAVRICGWLERRARDLRALVVWVGPFIALLALFPSLRDQLAHWIEAAWTSWWRAK